MQLGDLRARVLSAQVNREVLALVPQALVDMLIDHSVQKAWREIVRQNESLARATVTLADTNHLPGDWCGYADRSYYTLSGNRVPFFWIPVQKLAAIETGIFSAATASNPAIFFANQIVNTRPAGLTGVVISYYQRPPLLFGQLDTTDDGLPLNYSTYVWREAAARLSTFFVDKKTGWQFNEKLRAENEESIRKFLAGRYQQATRDVRNIS